MTDLKPYFASAESATAGAECAAVAVPDLVLVEVAPTAESTGAESRSAEGLQMNKKNDNVEDVSKFVVKTARPNSKLILQNMEEVLNSVKKKHRQKHRRKREQKKLAQLEADAVAALTTTMSNATTNVEGGAVTGELHKKRSLEKKHHHKRPKPLQEKTQENGHHGSGHKKQRMRKSPLKSTSPNGSILKHFPRTPNKNKSELKKQVEEEERAEPGEVLLVMFGNKTQKADAVAGSAKCVKAANAFEIMMNARNRSIGSNTPGKEASPTADVREDAKATGAKRKLVLQEWAEKKGAAKRRLEEEERATYVNEQLENRSKRFKRMLVDGGPAKADVEGNKTGTAVGGKKLRKSNFLPRHTEEQPKHRGRFCRRINSDDSVEVPGETLTPDVETAEFLAKLSSPTKKRDSLLGYFPRKESPLKVSNKEEQPNNNLGAKTETPKTRSRRTAAVRTKKSSFDEVEEQPASAVASAMNARPRRSCVGRARYDYDLEQSPTKQQQSVGKTAKADKSSSELDGNIIYLDDSNSETMSSKTPTKLAPLFVRSMPRPGPDPVALKARQEFLMSGVPEKMRLEMSKQKAYEQTYEEALEYFPRVCHVQQLSTVERKWLLQLPSRPQFSFKLKPSGDVDGAELLSQQFIANRKAKAGRGRSNASKAVKTCTPAPPSVVASLPTVDNKRAIIKAWKQEFERFPTYKCYNQMREKYRYFSALDSAQDTEQVSESFVVTRRAQRTREPQNQFDPMAEEVKPPATAPNGELLFTEKYKPMLLEQVLVNLLPVTQLKDFLATWAKSGVASARNSQSLDESFDTTNDSNSSQNAVSSSVVLLGPVSSGKTNAVFALANDMNFNVLEINAGMKRTGKRLIQELQEATQSHQIRKDTMPTSKKSQKNLLKMSLNGLKHKKPNSQSNDSDASGGSSCSSELSQSARKCLILIEDADVVFEHDGGFIDAIYTLAASSKRPVIAVASNPNCAHLQRLMQQNTITFTAPNALNVSRFLAVLSLIENCPIHLDDLISLYIYNGKDLRRTLLELQFFVQSGGDRMRDRHRTLPVQKGSVGERTPQKHSDTGLARSEAEFFASPTKQGLRSEARAQQSQENDDQLGKESGQQEEVDVYTHRTLFEFFTVNQNEQWRIPFPVDFGLLRLNLGDVFHVAQGLNGTVEVQQARAVAVPCNKQRKSRSPKKAWLSSATGRTSSNRSTHNSSAKQSQFSPLDALSQFYENISVAALLGGKNDAAELTNVDRLLPHLAENLTHELVEQSIAVNLAAQMCPYNLFDTSTERQKLCEPFGGAALRSRSACALDFEPVLRAICRSEKQRANQERRSTRFYHYLRHSTANMCNFSTDTFDAACHILQEASPTTGAEALT